MRLREGTWILTIHVPHVGLSSRLLLNFQVLLRVDLQGVVSHWVGLPSIGPIIFNCNYKFVASCIVSVLIQEWFVINIVIGISVDLSVHVIFVNLEGHNGLNEDGGGPTSLRNGRVKICSH